jgi:hypothetical protein
VPDRLLYVTDPVHHAVAVLTLGDDGSIFRLQRVVHLVNTEINVPVDVAPTVSEIANPGFASNTTLAGGSALYVANRGNSTIVRLRQVAVPGLEPLGADRLNGIPLKTMARPWWP